MKSKLVSYLAQAAYLLIVPLASFFYFSNTYAPVTPAKYTACAESKTTQLSVQIQMLRDLGASKQTILEQIQASELSQEDKTLAVVLVNRIYSEKEANPVLSIFVECLNK